MKIPSAWSEISYNEEHQPKILTNKEKTWSKVSEFSFPIGKIIWKQNIHGYTSYSTKL